MQNNRMAGAREGLIEIVVFDLDGTLLNSLDDLTDAVNGSLAAMGFDTHTSRAYQSFIGDGMKTLVRRALPHTHRSENHVDQCLQDVLQRYRSNCVLKTRPYPGIPAMLDRLSADLLPLAICTNKPHDLALQTVAKLLPKWSFAAISGTRDGIPDKPDPTAALHIAAALYVAPAQCIYLGDSGADMQAARRAGMYAVGATWGFRPPEELRADGAQYLVSSPCEFADLIKERNNTK